MKLLLACALVLLGPLALAQEARPFPLEAVAPELQGEVQRVRRGATVSAPVPVQRVRCRSAVYRTLLGHLPLAARWLRALDLGDYAIEDLPAGKFRVDDKLGARATCERALDRAGELVVVARGVVDVPVLPKIHGTGVILIRYLPNPDDPGILDCTAQVDFRLKSGFLHLLSQPLRRVLEGVLARKLTDLIRSATSLAEAIHRDPTGVLKRLEAAGVSKADCEEFRRLFLAL